MRGAEELKIYTKVKGNHNYEGIGMRTFLSVQTRRRMDR